ncbi:MAG: YecA family protein, partial [Oscillospiraceae bacterium]
IDSQNSGMITFDEFISFSEIARHEEHYYYILAKDELFLDAPEEDPIDREIVHESLVDIDIDEYYNMVESQYNKPLNILSKQELLNYKKDLYIADTPQVRAMEHFFRTRLKMNTEKAKDMVSECTLIITCDDRPFDAMMETLERMNINMTKYQLDEFIKLFSDLHNNTRLPRNRGFTPNELAQRYGGLKMPQSISFGPNITAGLKSGEIDANEFGMSIVTSDLPEEVKIQMLGELAKSQGVNAAPKKVGRNDPCPCGSGKKYKKCCGK